MISVGLPRWQRVDKPPRLAGCEVAASLESPWRQVAKDVIDSAQEYYSMTYRVALIPFDLVFRNDDPCMLNVSLDTRG